MAINSIFRNRVIFFLIIVAALVGITFEIKYWSFIVAPVVLITFFAVTAIRQLNRNLILDEACKFESSEDCEKALKILNKYSVHGKLYWNFRTLSPTSISIIDGIYEDILDFINQLECYNINELENLPKEDRILVSQVGDYKTMLEFALKYIEVNSELFTKEKVENYIEENLEKLNYFKENNEFVYFNVRDTVIEINKLLLEISMKLPTHKESVEKALALMNKIQEKASN